MRVLWIAPGVLLGIALWACGPTIGDACTTASDCGKGICLQSVALPGGYCSRECGDAGSCPNGTACVPGAGPSGVEACLIRCTQGQDCRSGYTCLSLDGGAASRVCVGS